MPNKEAIKVENKLFISMLEEAARNKDIKTILSQIAHVLSEKVLSRLEQETKEAEFSALPKSTQDALSDLAYEHSAEGGYGAIMPEVTSSKDIINSKENILSFLAAQKKVFDGIPNVHTVDEIAIVLKTLLELGQVYYNAPKAWHSSRFKETQTIIFPGTEETDIRLKRTELQEEAKLALTFGIDTEESDLGLETKKEGFVAGKSVFGKVSMEAKLEFICSEYDKTKSFADKMEYYGISLEIDKRKALAYYAKKWETFFEKLVRNANGKTPLPLIASVSRNTARLLIALQDLGIFYETEGRFNFDKAQIFANCIVAFIGHSGHHSFVEMAEVYDRLLDDAAIHHVEEYKSPIVSVEANERVEEKLPFYRYGNYASFFHNSYVEKIIEAVPQLRMR